LSAPCAEEHDPTEEARTLTCETVEASSWKGGQNFGTALPAEQATAAQEPLGKYFGKEP
jgi:hypothetical protein